MSNLNETKETECTGCEYLGNDGCGPGTVMLCNHPTFNGIHDYSNAIVYWSYIGNDIENSIVMSCECPKKYENSS